MLECPKCSLKYVGQTGDHVTPDTGSIHKHLNNNTNTYKFAENILDFKHTFGPRKTKVGKNKIH